MPGRPTHTLTPAPDDKLREDRIHMRPLCLCIILGPSHIFLYVIRFAKIRLITGKHNCSYKPFLLAKLIFDNFLFSSNIKKYDSSAIYSVWASSLIIALTYVPRSLERPPQHMPSCLGTLWREIVRLYYWPHLPSLAA